MPPQSAAERLSRRIVEAERDAAELVMTGDHRLAALRLADADYLRWLMERNAQRAAGREGARRRRAREADGCGGGARRT